MAGIDTNILVRWIVNDDPAQVARVQTLFEAARRDGAQLLVPCSVTLELEWVLRHRYRLAKPVVLRVFNTLLETQELAFDAEPAVERALHAYRSAQADFADCLHAGLCSAAGQAPLLSFDARAARLADVMAM